MKYLQLANIKVITYLSSTHRKENGSIFLWVINSIVESVHCLNDQIIIITPNILDA